MRTLHTTVFLLFVILTTIHAQAINPNQTVNTATGEMSLSIPLGTVNGKNSTNFPINLNYKSGIQCGQEASEVGLGFSYGAGSITRKVIFVPDDNIGGSGNYSISNTDPNCTIPAWVYIVQGLVFIIGFALSVWSGGAGFAVATMVSAGMLVLNEVPGIVSNIYFSSINFTAGGDHTPTYSGNGAGFFEGGFRDLPDVYFAATPWFSGEFVWSGDAENGKFVMRNPFGSNIKEEETVKIDTLHKDITINGTAQSRMVFRIKLSDGTTLYFDEIDAASDYSQGNVNKETTGYVDCDHKQKCESSFSTAKNEMTTLQWHLTRVLKPDYRDGSTNSDYWQDPLNSLGMNKGGWIAFQYETVGYADRYISKHTKQVGPNTLGEYFIGKAPGRNGQGVYFNHFRKVITSDETAEFIYPQQSGLYDREDKFWTKSDDELDIVKDPRLAEIQFKNSDGTIRKKISFEQDYSLKKNRVVQCGSPEISYGSLTLRKVNFWDIDSNTIQAPIEFEYGENRDLNNSCAYGVDRDWRYIDGTFTVRQSGECMVNSITEWRDLWGYYFDNFQLVAPMETFNMEGCGQRLVPQAWSMVKARLPDGMEISWEYDKNRYAFANGAAVSNTCDGGPKYGGGPRVSKMIVEDGYGGSYTRSYFYTNTIGDFEETDSTGSGYASVEPRPFYSETDNRPYRARGGLYTPAVVAYEMVQVADNFIEPNGTYPDGFAPQGFTVYKYTHCGDSTHDDYYPNYGPYGEFDYQWMRGHLVYQGIYNSSKKCLSSKTMEYEFELLDKIGDEPPVKSVFDADYSDDYNLYRTRMTGKVKLLRTTSVTNGVTTTATPCQASELTSDEPDKLLIHRMSPKLTTDTTIQQSSRTGANEYTRIIAVKRDYAGSDTSKDDFILLRKDSLPYWEDNYIDMCFGTDVESYSSGTPPYTGTWSGWQKYEDENNIPELDPIIGAGFYDMGDGDGQEDLVVVFQGDGTIWLTVMVMHDFEFNGTNFTYNEVTYTELLSADYYDYYNKNDGYGQPNGCVIGNITGTGAPEIIILTGEKYNYLEFAGNRFQALVDFEDRGTTDGQRITMHDADVYRSEDLAYYGSSGYLNDEDGNGNLDLVVAGVGAPGDPDVKYMFRKVFNDIDFDSSVSPQKITFSNVPAGWSSGEPDIQFNCSKGSSSWRSKSFAGVFPSADFTRQKYLLVFPWSMSPYYDLHTIEHNPYTVPVDYDGQPNRSYTKNSDGSYLLNVAIPAYFKYMTMGRPDIIQVRNHLSYSCGSVAYHLPAMTTEAQLKGDLSGYSDKVVSAKATTWGQFNSVWLPKANYVWHSDMDNNGLPVTSFTEFNYDNLSNNDPDTWRLADSISRYNDNSQAVEVAKPTPGGKRIFSSVILGKDGTLQSGTVTKAQFMECGVFTGDYQGTEEPENWLDKENGWEKGEAYDPNNPLSDSTVEIQPVPHFGEASIHVKNAFGPSRNFRLTEGRNYEMSAWVKVVNGNAYMHGAFYSKDKSADTAWPVMVPTLTEIGGGSNLTPAQSGTTGGEWVMLQMEVPASTVPASADWDNNNIYARVFVGALTGGEVYIDDIRFAPSDAMVSSTYYDQLWQQPIISVDANNHPGRKVTYDSFGRPVLWQKLDPVAMATLPVQHKEYHLRNELPTDSVIALLSPDGGESVTAGANVTVRWVNAGTEDIKLYYKVGSGSYAPITASALPSQSGWSSYSWTVPTTPGDYFVKAQIEGGTNGGKNDASDRAFAVVAP